MASLHPTVTTNDGADRRRCTARRQPEYLDRRSTLRRTAALHGCSMSLPRHTPRGRLSFGSHNRIPVGRILASDDGTNFRTIVVMPGPQGYHGAAVRTYAFPAVTAKFFRMELDGAGLLPAAVIHGGPAIPAPQYTLTEAILYSERPRESMGGQGSLRQPDGCIRRCADARCAGCRGDIAQRHRRPHVEDGQGRHAALGCSGRELDDSAHGLLADRREESSCDRGRSGLRGGQAQREVRSNRTSTATSIRSSSISATLTGSTLQYMTMDSWEAGMQNWTDEMIAEFQRRRGYDPTPVSSGARRPRRRKRRCQRPFSVGLSPNARRHVRGEFYGTMDGELHKKGMGAYAEASGVALEIPEDTLLNKSKVDIPMAEFWVHALHPESMYYVDVRGAASAAHVYGKPIVATESFTGGGYESPYTLKKIADYWFAQGVNRLVFHTSAAAAARHQARQHHGGHAYQSQHHLGGTGEALHDLRRARLVHAAAGQSRGGPRLSAARRRAFDHALLGRRASARSAAGIRLRLHQHRRSAPSHERRHGWPHHL